MVEGEGRIEGRVEGEMIGKGRGWLRACCLRDFCLSDLRTLRTLRLDIVVIVDLGWFGGVFGGT